MSGQMSFDLAGYKPRDSALPKVDWSPPTAEQTPSWANAKRVSIDLECKDLDLKTLGPGCRRGNGDRVVGVGVSIEDGPEHYFAISHEGGDNCNWDVWSYIREQIKDFKGAIVGNGLGYDLDWLAENDCDVLNKRIMDCQVLDVLLNELHDRYDLDTLCSRYGLPGKDEAMMREAASAYRIHPKKDLWKLPARFVANYCMADARRPLQILRRQEREMVTEGVEDIWSLEQKVTPILIKMRRRGIRVDLDHVDKMDALSKKNVADCLDEVHIMTNFRIAAEDIMKPAALEPALRDRGYEPPLTPVTKKASIDRKFLEQCGEVGALLLRARQWRVLSTTFCAQIRRFEVKGRANCSFNQLRSSNDEGEGRGVRYGRLSSSYFNIQQQPMRHEEYGKSWRRVFLADEGAQFVSGDWSQQEPRIAVHYAELLSLPGAKEFADAYRANPSLDIHQKLADIAGMPRVIVKGFVNGRLYGMGDAKLCKSIGLPTKFIIIRGERREVAGDEGRAKIDEFNRFAPWVKGLTRSAAKAAEKNGHVWTILRRKCHFNRMPSGDVYGAHKAFNRVGQGSAADQMKATLVAADAEGIPIQASVHDEFCFSTNDLSQAERMRALQLSTVTFSVPMKVTLKVGPSWGEMEEL